MKEQKLNNIDLEKTLLHSLPQKVYFESNRELLYTNGTYSNIIQQVHLYIEAEVSNKKSNLPEQSSIKRIKLYEERTDEKIYAVFYEEEHIMKEFFVSRVCVNRDDLQGILYTHQPMITGFFEQARLQKMIRANELIMEIRDIFDYVDDLDDIFAYLLSKIHTVIPDADRSCVLNLDSKNRLYLNSSFGFNDEYKSEFRLPFKKSYAYMHMGNDYSKSVIINDIQERYSDLFPDIKEESMGFKIQSNVTTPIVVNDKLYGIISVDSDKNNTFDDVDLHLLDFIKKQIEKAIKEYRKYSKIKKDSTVDSLTGIPNRRQLLNVLPKYQEQAEFDQSNFYFVLLDMDKLKFVNDSYGHLYGDEIIKTFASVISKSIRATDFVARIGGDEFVTIFYDIDIDIVKKRIHNWEKHFTKYPILIDNQEVYLDFSYGIASYKENGPHFSSLLTKADELMYLHKRSKNKK